MDCTGNFIFFDESLALTDKCYYANQCQEVQRFINIYSIVFCKLEGSWGYFLVCFIPGILILFRLMSIVIESYLTPSIEFITEKLKISQQLSAVTLLALANGAGDVITAIVASDNLEGVNFNIGSLYGAGLFVATIVIGVTIINSKGFIQMQPTFILRDILFYIISTIIVILYGVIAKFSTIDSIVLLSLYCILIIIVAIQEKRKEKRITVDPLIGMDETQEDQEFQEFQIVEEKSLSDKIFCIIDIPFKWVLKFFIPPTPQNFSKTLLIVSILPSLTFIYFILADNISNPYKYLNVLSLSILFGTIIYSTSNNEPPRYYVIVQFYVVMVSLVWIYLLSGILIDSLTFFGMLSNLAPSYLGMTVIAMGNALPDGLVTMALAKQGYATMAMTGAYLGQVFGLLVGLGLSLLKTNIRTGKPVSFDLFNKELISENIIMQIVIFSTLGVLIITFVYGIFKNYRFARDLSLVLIFIYIAIFCAVTTIALYNIF